MQESDIKIVRRKQIIRFRWYLKLLLISAFFTVLRSVSAYPQSDSLMSYLGLAARNNPTVLQRFSEYKAALQKVPQAGSLPDPELTAGVFISPMELNMGYQLADFKLMQMFPWFGTLMYAKDEMSQMAKAKYESFREARFEVFFDVQSTWYDLYKLEQDIRISERNLQILKTIERLALVRYRTAGALPGGVSSSQVGPVSSGLAPLTTSGSPGMQGMSGGRSQTGTSGMPSSQVQGGSMGGQPGGSGLSDLYRIQIEISNMENNIALLKSQKNSETAKFNSFINRPPQTAVTIADTLTADSLSIPLTTLSDSILKNNPALGMIRYEQQSLEAKGKMISRMGYPMLGVGVDYAPIRKFSMADFPGNGKDMVMPMVSVTIPIYRKKYRGMKDETDLMKTAWAQNYSATVNDLRTEYYQALQLYDDAGRRIKLYSYQYLLAQKSLDITIRSYSTAGSTLTDILMLQQQVLDYELKKTEAVADFNTAIAWLNKLGSSETAGLNLQK